jgi:ribosomal protein S18 acetylase RimI-like enzyme
MRRHIRPAADADWPEVRAMLREYEAWVEVSLCFQGFEAEVNGLPGQYGPPRGACFVAEIAAPAPPADARPANSSLAGMVALRPVGGDTCEMKRLYVRSSARGLGLGEALVARAMDEARRLGYSDMRLDTLPKMARAQSLYERLGFRDIAPYYDSPVAGTRFMSVSLR